MTRPLRPARQAASRRPGHRQGAQASAVRAPAADRAASTSRRAAPRPPSATCASATRRAHRPSSSRAPTTYVPIPAAAPTGACTGPVPPRQSVAPTPGSRRGGLRGDPGTTPHAPNENLAAQSVDHLRYERSCARLIAVAIGYAPSEKSSHDSMIGCASPDHHRSFQRYLRLSVSRSPRHSEPTVRKAPREGEKPPYRAPPRLAARVVGHSCWWRSTCASR